MVLLFNEKEHSNLTINKRRSLWVHGLLKIFSIRSAFNLYKNKIIL